MVQTVGHRWLTVPTAAPNTYLNARQEEMELYLRRERGGVGVGGVYMVPWYTMESLCDSFSTFHRQDYVLSQQTAG